MYDRKFTDAHNEILVIEFLLPESSPSLGDIMQRMNEKQIRHNILVNSLCPSWHLVNQIIAKLLRQVLHTSNPHTYEFKYDTKGG